MTAYIADIARWQNGMPLSELVKAGFGAVNIKISHGLETGAGLYPGQPDDIARAKEARGQKLRICTFHWLTGTASGSAQAKVAFDRIKALGGPAGIAHSVDAEDQDSPPTWTIWSDYVKTMRSLLSRPVFAYTGDWWWAERMPNRNGAVLTPYLWAAPNAGYLASYPGDKSSHWSAGYGGWTDLAAMQYAVEPPFGTGVTTTVKVSKTAIRDLNIWKSASGVAW
jgi:hypothetical protein